MGGHAVTKNNCPKSTSRKCNYIRNEINSQGNGDDGLNQVIVRIFYSSQSTINSNKIQMQECVHHIKFLEKEFHATFRQFDTMLVDPGSSSNTSR